MVLQFNPLGPGFKIASQFLSYYLRAGWDAQCTHMIMTSFARARMEEVVNLIYIVG